MRFSSGQIKAALVLLLLILLVAIIRIIISSYA
jgi:uncharacterized protein (UPF0333 family)